MATLKLDSGKELEVTLREAEDGSVDVLVGGFFVFSLWSEGTAALIGNIGDSLGLTTDNRRRIKLAD